MHHGENTKRTLGAEAHRWGLRHMATLGLIALAACAPPRPAAQPPRAAPVPTPAPARSELPEPAPREVPPPEARDIRFLLESQEGSIHTPSAEAQLRAFLTSAGYHLVGASSNPDATLRFRLEDAGADGASGHETERVSVQVVHEGTVAQWLVGPLREADRRSQALADLVDRLSTSPALASLAVASKEREEARRRDSSTDRGPRTEPSESTVGFSAALARRCLNQRSRSACTKLADYVAANPEGSDAERARAILERSQGARAE